MLGWWEAELKETLSGPKIQQGILNSHSAVPPGDCCIYRCATVTLNCTLLYLLYHSKPVSSASVWATIKLCLSCAAGCRFGHVFLQQKCILSVMFFSKWFYLLWQRFGCSDSETSHRDNAGVFTFHVFNLQQRTDWSCRKCVIEIIFEHIFILKSF